MSNSDEELSEVEQIIEEAIRPHLTMANPHAVALGRRGVGCRAEPHNWIAPALYEVAGILNSEKWE